MFSSDTIDYLKNNPSSWNFCFEFESKNNEIIRLTDADHHIKHNDKLFLSYSGLEFIHGIFDDGGQSEIKLKGFFKNKGLTPEFILQDAKISIFIYLKSNILEKWVEYYCKEISNDNNEFELILASLILKYESSVVKFYSTTCRANLGDNQCKVLLTQGSSQVCDKSFRMCCNKYNNAVNFRGEPFIPTLGYFSNKYDK